MLVWLLAACEPVSESDDSGIASGELLVALDNISAAGALASSAGPVDIVIAPGLLLVHDPDWTLFHAGDRVSGLPLEALAEDGDPAALTAVLADMPEVDSVTLLAAQDGTTYEAAAMGPGGHAAVLVSIRSDQRLSFVAMFGQSNDVLISTPPGGVTVLRPDGTVAPVPLGLFDAGTEANEEPGVGENQAPRQAAANTGESTTRGVARIETVDVDGWVYPDPLDFVTLTATLQD